MLSRVNFYMKQTGYFSFARANSGNPVVILPVKLVLVESNRPADVLCIFNIQTIFRKTQRVSALEELSSLLFCFLHSNTIFLRLFFAICHNVIS
jgi:hypothetical protein